MLEGVSEFFAIGGGSNSSITSIYSLLSSKETLNLTWSTYCHTTLSSSNSTMYVSGP